LQDNFDIGGEYVKLDCIAIMFAVPGWAVSADTLALQRTNTSPKPIKSDVQKTQEQAFADSKSKSKKRKRSEGEPTPSSRVSAEDLEKLWNKRFGTKPAQNGGKRNKIDPSLKIVGFSQNEHDHTSVKPKEQRKSKSLKPPLPKESNEFPSKSIEQSKPKKSQRARSEAQDGIQDQPTEVEPESRVKPLVQGGDIASHKKSKRDKKTKHDNIDRESKSKSEGTPTLPQPNSRVAALLPKAPPPPPAKLTPLQAKMRSKLTSARFRHLNQTLYTTDSTSALELFKQSPDLFAEYHAGFSQQVRDSWPLNPVEVYIRSIKTRGAASDTDDSTLPLPRRKTGSCTIADLGCGDAPLARGCQSHTKALQLKFHSFDLHAPNSHVTVADISALPLRDGEADIAVFCLSLMGTNWVVFVEEAWRILRGDGKGECWVSEVKSRFGRVGNKKEKGRVVENSVGKRRKQKVEDEEALAEADGAEATDETDISAFVEVFQRRGFQLKPESVSKGNKMFVSMVFVKSGIPTAGKHKGKKWNGKEYKVVHDGKMRFKDDQEGEIDSLVEAAVLKPCVYKTR
jgi:ribosomal RNA-processing protein 8